MLVYYSSFSGNVRRFADRLPAHFEVYSIDEHPKAAGPFILLTYTFGFGIVPEPVEKWLKENGDLIRGVAASGNRNWGGFYGRAGDIIAAQYHVPLLLKFELSGTQSDTEELIRKAALLDE